MKDDPETSRGDLPAGSGRPVVIIVDDDLEVLEATEMFLDSAGYDAIGYVSFEALKPLVGAISADAMVVDVRLADDVDGIVAYAELRAKGWSVPTIFVTGHGNIPMAVRAMRAGAVDFLDKPYLPQRLLQTLAAALSPVQDSSADVAMMERLLPKEAEVLAGLVAGKTNKQIAADLAISQRTVEVHRVSIMEKFETNSLPDVVRIALKAARSNEHALLP